MPSPQIQRELETTREKLRLLKESYAELQQETGGDQRARELTMRSLKRRINQLTEEIARFKRPDIVSA